MRFCSFTLALLFIVVTLTVPQPLGAAKVELNEQVFTLPDGLTIEQVAHPPLVNRPISASFDEQGRLYITDSSGSNENVKVQLEKKPHRIVQLRDLNHDGTFDQSTVYADQLMFPEGALWLDGSLYVAAPPQIWKFTDLDDNGVSDKREVWFDGKTLTGCANDLHGPYLGPDGWIYWCKGAFAEQTHQQPGRNPLVTRAAHIFRRHPSGGPIESVMTGGMDNPVDVIFTPGGERIFTTTFLVHPGNGQRDGTIHAVYGGVYGKFHGVLEGHPRTGSVMPVLSHLGAAAPCGLHRIHSDHLGSNYRNNLMACAFSMRSIFRHELTKSGGSFEAKVSQFLTSDHVDFHPTDVIEDADGSLIVVDTGGWYKLCCPTSQLEKPDVLGAVYRVRRSEVAPKNNPRGLDLSWQSLSNEELVRHLGDSRWAVAERAKQTLAKRGPAAIGVIADMLHDIKDPIHRRRSVWTLTWFKEKEARVAVRTALSDPNEDVRQAAIHSISIHRDKDSLAPVLELLDSPSDHNRRAAAEAIGRIGSASDISKVLLAAGNTTDRTVDHSLIYASLEIGNVSEIRKMLSHPEPGVVRAAIIALDQVAGSNIRSNDVVKHFRSDFEPLRQSAWWVAERHSEWAEDFVGYFTEQLSNPIHQPKTLAELGQRLARFTHAPAIQQMVAHFAIDESTSMDVKKILLRTMIASRPKQLPVAWKEPLLEYLNSTDQATLAEAVGVMQNLTETDLSEEFMTRLYELAAADQVVPHTRLQALKALPSGGRNFSDNLFHFLCEHLNVDIPIQLRALAVDVIATSPLSLDQQLAIADALRSTGTIELKRLMEMFAKHEDQQLGLKLVESLEQCPSITGLDLELLKQQLSNFGDEVLTKANPLFSRVERDTFDRIQKIDVVLKLMDHADIRRGHQVWHSARAACVACHQMGYKGGQIGPDLSRIGKIRTERDLLESILFPSLSFVRSYEPISLVTTNGRVLNGIVKNETADEITLVMDHQKILQISLDEIEERRPGAVSIMPAGLEKHLSAQQLADLVRFLKSR